VATETGTQELHWIIKPAHIPDSVMKLFRFILDLLKPRRQTFRNSGKKCDPDWGPASPGFL
jgi:hypothetical protein